MLLSYSIHETGKREMEEFTVLQTLTGWIPEVIPLQYVFLLNNICVSCLIFNSIGHYEK